MNLFFLRYVISLAFGTIITFVLGNIPIRENILKILGIFGLILGLEASLVYIAGLDVVLCTYPLHTHLILILFLIFCLKIRFFNAAMYVMLAYMCCQVPAWLTGFFTFLVGRNLVAEIIVYLIFVVITSAVVILTIGDSAKELIGQSLQSNIAFGLIPVIYYFFDYAATLWTDLLYSGSYLATQFMPFVLCIGYLVFIVSYRNEQKQRQAAYEEKLLIENKIEMIEAELDNIREIENMSRIYRHDLRHHFTLLLALIQENKLAQAESYICENIQAVAESTPEHYCDIDVLNLLLTHYGRIFKELKIDYSFNIDVPQTLYISNMEICALVSNALENACAASQKLPEEKRRLELIFKEHNAMLVFSVDNACEENTDIKAMNDNNESTTAANSEHGFGTKSIMAIVRKHNGSAEFSVRNGMFRTMVIIRSENNIS